MTFPSGHFTILHVKKLHRRATRGHAETNDLAEAELIKFTEAYPSISLEVVCLDVQVQTGELRDSRFAVKRLNACRGTTRPACPAPQKGAILERVERMAGSRPSGHSKYHTKSTPEGNVHEPF
jgi:hypothetical protein